MERVLASANLLAMILDNADRSTQAQCARVSRSWFDPALRNLWSSLDDIIHLLRLLPKVSYGSAGPVLCYEADTESDWERFNLYRSFIRKLVLKCAEADMIHRTLSTFAYANSMTNLLPNLVDLTIHSGPFIFDSILFIHKGLRTIVINDIDEASIHFVLKHVISRTKSVRSLKMYFSVEVNAIVYEQVFRSIFKEMLWLEELTFSNLNITDRLLQFFASLPELRKFEYLTPQRPSASANQEESKVVPASVSSAEDNQFSFLEHICLQTTSEMVSQFLLLGHNFSSIRRLELVFVDLATEATLRKSSEKLALQWYTIFDLSIKINVELMDGDKHVPLKFDTFCHLSGLRQIQSFVFSYATPLVIDNEQVLDLLESWPMLTRFVIRYISYDELPGPTLDVLGYFAMHCKDIRELRLYVNANKVNEANIGTFLPVMGNLETISFGISPIEDVEAVAIYLSQLCPPSCQLALENTVELNKQVADTGKLEPMDRYREKWREVAKMLHTILKALERERRKASSLLSSSQT